jgi:Xaa-Pro aminopeptidase
MTATETRRRLDSLRTALRDANVAACLIPSSDPHLSEYPPERWQGRAWFSGFSGSAGTLIVTVDFAGLWVDSRYWVQAEAQTDGTGIAVMRVPGATSAAHVDWLAANLPRGATVAVDGAVLALEAARALEEKLGAAGVRLRTDLDLLDRAWPGRPALPAAPIRAHDAFEPVARTDKLAVVRTQMQAASADWHLISTVDDIAWLTNLRGADVTYNPVFIAHLLIGPQRAQLFVGAGKVPAEVMQRLAVDGIDLRPYEDMAAAVIALPAGAVLLIDPKRITLGLRTKVPSTVRVIEAINPSTLAKSRKTDGEIANIRRAMEEDGAALAEFFAWFEAALARKEPMTELTIDARIGAARALRPGFVSPSFSTIAGFNASGALPHYRATEESHAVICDGETAPAGLLLIDSGGQYDFGTTDITRVVSVGATTVEQRRDFTRVLMGMIALSMAVFPRGTRSPQLDALARAPIWAAGINYGHGTGHGVGYALNVHEGPQSISPYMAPEPHTAMEPGMVTSNEPGIYRPGRWGVRIENLMLAVPAVVEAGEEFGEFLRFEALTLCPIDTRCIERDLLRTDEIAWLNTYHAEVRRRIAPLVSGEAAAWLELRTQPL